MAKPDLADYIEVRERIAAFHERYPDGSLQGRHWIENHGGQDFLVYQAKAYRSPDDKRPGIGHAWEPLPGVTPYTKSSELMVGETSGWGRALAALGFEVSRSIASREEVTAREGNGERPQIKQPDDPATPAQKGKVTHELNARVAMAHHDDLRNAFNAGTKGGASTLIEALLTKPLPQVFAEAGVAMKSDVPADTEGLPPAPSEEELSQLGLKADDE